MSGKHSWTFEEDHCCCKAFFDVYVVGREDMSLSDFVRWLSRKLPDVKPGSVRLKVQNIKCLAAEYGVENTLHAAARDNYSKQNKAAFETVLKEYSIDG